MDMKQRKAKEAEERVRNEARVRRIREEYPWIDTHVNPRNLLGASISRIHQELLDGKIRWGYTGIMNDRFGKDTEIYFLDKSGGKLLEVGVIEPVPDPSFRWWQFWKWLNRCESCVNETPGQALERMGESSGKVHYILELVPVANGRFYHAVIFKGPRGFTLKDWAGQVRLRSQNAERQRRAAIEDEAERQLEEEESAAESAA